MFNIEFRKNELGVGKKHVTNVTTDEIAHKRFLCKNITRIDEFDEFDEIDEIDDIVDINDIDDTDDISDNVKYTVGKISNDNIYRKFDRQFDRQFDRHIDSHYDRQIDRHNNSRYNRRNKTR